MHDPHLDPRMVEGGLHSQAGVGVEVQQSHHQVLGLGRDGAPVLGPHLPHTGKGLCRDD